MPPSSLLRQIPAVDTLLRRPALAPYFARLGPAASRRLLACELAALRAAPTPAKLASLESDLAAAAQRRLRPSLRPVINATGVILHTNLGRAPLAPAAARRLLAIATNYSNLEFDLDSGRRAPRDHHLDALLAELTGAPRSLVVNNNAAAVVLALNTLVPGQGGEVLVSRGELVEIGESFRIADIITRAGAKLVEVGSTNRTRVDDYARALTPQTRLLLRVHRSNFTQAGFVAQPALSELAALARRARLPLVEDLGSGCLADLPGLPAQPTPRDSLAAGVDVVTFSGDKLLGGPQAGLICGRSPLLARLRANPLFRALRPDRLILAALEATLQAYARESWRELPVFVLQAAPGLEQRVRAFAAQLPPEMCSAVAPGVSLPGGGASPGQALPAWLLAVGPRGGPAAVFARRLRLHRPAVVARLHAGRCWLDLRTVFPRQEPALLQALLAALQLPATSNPVSTS